MTVKNSELEVFNPFDDIANYLMTCKIFESDITDKLGNHHLMEG